MVNPLIVLLFLPGLLSLDSSSFVNQEVTREINLTGRYSKVKTSIVALNPTDSAQANYLYTVSDGDYEKLGHIQAYSSYDTNVALHITDDTQNSCCGYHIMQIALMSPTPPSSHVSLVIEEVFANKLIPLPKKIGIYDSQFLKFSANGYFYSPYSTVSSSTQVFLPTEAVESYTRELTNSKEGKTITYGPHANLPPFASSTIEVHYLHNIPLPYFSRVEREIEVSHWGNIGISDQFFIENRGAGVKGEFSRNDYANRNRPAAQNVLESIDAILPRSAWGLSLRDEIGNVSSSNARKQTNHVLLEVRPRFPLMGGWKSNWNIGYNLPIKYFVKEKDGVYLLNTTFGVPFREVIAEELLVRVILPEGAYEISHLLPFTVESVHYEVVNSYLDVVGRPTVVFFLRNAVDFHRKPFQLTYKLPGLSILGEPLMLSALVFGFLLLLIVYFRFNLKLDKHKHYKTE